MAITRQKTHILRSYCFQLEQFVTFWQDRNTDLLDTEAKVKPGLNGVKP